jgi:hypothetical protein
VSARRYILLMIAGLIVLVGCGTAGYATGTSSTQQTMRTATVVPSPTPLPPTPGPMPRNCAITTAQPQAKFPQLAPVIGAAPVWVAWPPGPSVFEIFPSTSAKPSVYIAPYGWPITKLIWEVGPNYSSTIAVRGHDVTDRTPLFFQFGEAPTADAVLDPQHPDHPGSVVGDGWAEWGSYIIVPKAGCYVMEVSWPTGHWDITFAVGASST